MGWVPEGQTVNQVLTNLREWVRRRPEMWKDGSWVLHQDNGLAHSTLTMLEHRLYSPDLALCDFFLFPKMKFALKGTRFESMYAVKAKATEFMNKLSEDDLQHCFQQWKIHMERCRHRGGEYIEGYSMSIV